MRILFFASLVVLSLACESKPTREVSSKAANVAGKAANVAGKATEPATPHQTEVYFEVQVGPKGLVDNMNLWGNAKFLECLKPWVKSSPSPELRLSGRSTEAGRIEKLLTQGADPEAEKCLEQAFQGMAWGQGASGPFSLKLALKPFAVGKSRSFLLDLRPLKKLE
jgi:hypothetical protein